MPELIACPSCGCRVQVAEFQLGRSVRCIACNQPFVASSTPAPPSELHYPLAPTDTEPTQPRPVAEAKGLSRHRLPLCPSCQRPVSWEATSCPYCGHLFEPGDGEQFGDWIARRDSLPHRGKLIDTLGTLSMLAGTISLCFGPLGLLGALVSGVPVLIMANRDLEQMRRGLIDTNGRSLTELGRSKAIVGCVIAALFSCFWMFAVWEMPF